MQYLRRLLWFIASRLLIFTLCAALLVLVFYTALNMANIYILVTEGMETRVERILTRDSATELNAFFRDEFLAEDQALRIAQSDSSPYLDYKITSYKTNEQVDWVRSWPWEDTATACITETVTEIAGNVVPESQKLLNDGLIGKTPPSWQGAQYIVTLQRAGGRWRIAGLRQIAVVESPTPAPTPASTPKPTPTPRPGAVG